MKVNRLPNVIPRYLVVSYVTDLPFAILQSVKYKNLMLFHIEFFS